jgi:hypothetical protein
MSWNPFSAIVNTVGSLGSTYIEGKNAVSKAKSEAAIISIKADADVKVAGAKAADKLAETGQTQEYNLDAKAMDQMEKSLTDDFMIALLLAPVIMAFIGYAEEVDAGFKAFESMPEWFQWLVIGVYVVKFGLRGLLSKILSGRLSGIKLK